MQPKIVVIGSSNVDLIMKMDHLPKVGETVTDATFMQTFGGKGANQAVGAARAGGNVYFVNCVGDDSYGPLVIENLRQAGVHVDYVFQASGIASGTALVMVGPRGENLLSVAPGANYRLGREHIDQAHSLIQEAAMIVLQYEVLPETLAYTIDVAAAAGKAILINLAPARPIEAETLAKVELLVVNESEAEFLCGVTVDSAANLEQAASALLAKGPRTVVLTLGANGAYLAQGDQRWRMPAFRVEAVDTTAAGDVFCGALAVALVEGRPLQESVRFANAAAAISVTRLGAQPSAPGRQEIDLFLEEAGEIAP